MGLAVPTGIIAGQRDPQEYLQENGWPYSRFKHKISLGGGKFLSAHKCSYPEQKVDVVVKIYVKREKASLQKYGLASSLHLLRDKASIHAHPNIFPYQHFKESHDAAFLVRQYLPYNLYDRFSTRPFLTIVEKKWITFQLLKGIEQCNLLNVRHGDLKSENILATSWNWIFLADFASFKPCFLPDNDTSGFDYFFISGRRRQCYLAPERFYNTTAEVGNTAEGRDAKKGSGASNDRTEPINSTSAHGPQHGELTEGMDIFSIGCVIAEMFMDGKAPLFDLAKLLKYRSGGSSSRRSLRAALEKFNVPGISKMVQSMLHHNVDSRLSASAYLKTYTQSAEDPDGAEKSSSDYVFPASFESFLFPFMASMLDVSNSTPDAKILEVCKNYGRIMANIVGIVDPAGQKFFEDRINQHSRESFGEDSFKDLQAVNNPGFAVLARAERSKDATKSPEELLDMLRAIESSMEELFDGDASGDSTIAGEVLGKSGNELSKDRTAMSQENEFHGKFSQVSKTGNGMVVVIQLICSCVESVNSCNTRLTALWLLQRFAMFCDDDVRLQRVVPFLVAMFRDRFALIRAAAIRGVTQVLRTVESLPLSDANLFPEYILPSLQHFVTDRAECVRLAFVDSLGPLATTSLRFLNISHVLKQNIALRRESHAKGAAEHSGAVGGGKDETSKAKSRHKLLIDGSFDFELDRLRDSVGNIISNLVAAARTTSNSDRFIHSMIKQALLKNLASLCYFFGPEKSNEKVFPWMISFMNDREDWQLRRIFFNTITAAAPYIPDMVPTMIPFIEDALADSHELVIQGALECMINLTKLEATVPHDLIQMKATCARTAPLLVHPCEAIRTSAIKYFSLLCKILPITDYQVFVFSSVRHFLRGGFVQVDKRFFLEETDVQALFHSLLLPPLERSYFNSILESDNPPENEQLDAAFKVEGASVLKNEQSAANIELLSQYLRAAWSQHQLVTRFAATAGRSRSKSSRSDSNSSATAQPPVGNSFGRLSFNGPLPLKKFLNLQGVPQRTISVPDQRFLLSSDYTGTSHRGRSRLGKNLSGSEILRSLYGTVAIHEDDGGRLRKQFEALRIPKLPPYTGFLVDENGFEYSTYGLSGDGRVFKSENYIPEETVKSMQRLSSMEGSRVGGSKLGRETGNHGIVKAGLLAKLVEHKAAVSCIANTDDHSVFLTGSRDATIRLWNPSNLFHGVSARSSAVHKACDGGEVTSMVAYDNARTFVYGTEKGTLEAVCFGSAPFSQVRKESTVGEGAVQGIATLTGPVSSCIVYATEKGILRAVDLRMRKTALAARIHPELGSVSCLTACSDSSSPWMLVGTQNGYVSLWDLRFNVMAKLWCHSARDCVRKLVIPGRNVPNVENPSHPQMFVATGENEVSLWDIVDGSCHSIYRSLPENVTKEQAYSIPTLQEVPVQMGSSYQMNYEFKTFRGRGIGSSPGATSPKMSSAAHVVSSFLWSGNGLPGLPSSSQKLITSGTEKYIRVWETSQLHGSYTFQLGMGRNLDHMYDSFDEGSTRINVSQTLPSLRSKTMAEQNNSHQMASSYSEGNILDMKFLYCKQHLLLTGDAQGVVKVYKWNSAPNHTM